MLTQLQIRDFAIINQLDLECYRGMGVLTGETGAGKSILLDAIALILGARAEQYQIRDGADRADVCATFSIAHNPQARAWLEQHDMAAGTECLLRRSLRRDGRSRNFINDHAVALHSMRALGGMLVDIHGQHEHQLLLRTGEQRAMLDRYAENGPVLEKLAKSCQGIQEIDRALADLESDTRHDQAFLQHQLDELQQANLEPAHIAQIELEHKRAHHAQELLGECQQVLELIAGSDLGVSERLGKAKQRVDRLVGFDQRLQPINALLDEVTIQCQEVRADLTAYLSGIELDQQALARLEQELQSLHEMARKHRVPLQELHQKRDALAHQIAGIAEFEQRCSTLQLERDSLLQQYTDLAAELSERRQGSAATLGELVSEQIARLGMQGRTFSILVEPSTRAQPSRAGLDDVSFMIATADQTPRPLAKIASGGELSRISLVLQLATLREQGVSTLIFDEIDSGIGGAVAERVGAQLAELSHLTQLMCVTHLPQVASHSAWHYLVDKNPEHDMRVTIHLLNQAERCDEIARMLGGVHITDSTREHAREMLERNITTVAADGS